MSQQLHMTKKQADEHQARVKSAVAARRSAENRKRWNTPVVPEWAIVSGVVCLPIVTVSVLNTREHWAKRAKRAKEHRSFAARMVRLLTLQVVPGVVKLTRIAPRKLDGDNLQGALKACRDGVADALGIDDGDPRVRWEYAQEKGQPGVRIELDAP